MNFLTSFKKIILHKNVLLIAVNVLILVGIYFFEEVPLQKRILEEETRGAFLTQEVLENWTSLKGNGLALKKLNNAIVFENKNLPFDFDAFQKWPKNIADFKIKNIIAEGGEKEWPLTRKEYIDVHSPVLKLSYDQYDLELVLGKKLAVGRDFYLHYKKIQNGQVVLDQLLLVYDSSIEEGIYKAADYANSSSKYLKAWELFNVKDESFIDKKVFSQNDLKKWKENARFVTVSNYRNPLFQIDLKEKKTIPSLISKRPYLEKMMEDYFHSLINLKAIEVFAPPANELLKEKLGEIKIQGEQEVMAFFSVYRSYGSLTGPFLVHSLNPYMYKLSMTDGALFTASVQDFWEKQLAKELPRFAQLSFSNAQAQKKILNIEISPDGEEIKNTSNSYQLNLKKESFKKLIKLISSKADQIKAMDRDDLKKLPKEAMELSFNGENYKLIQDGPSLWAYDLNNKLKLEYFSFSQESPGTKWGDYIEERDLKKEKK